MTELPLSVVFPSKTSWMAQSPDAAPCSGIPPAHGSYAAGMGSQLRLCWAWPVAAVAETWESLREPAEEYRAVEEPVCTWGGKVWGTPPAFMQSRVEMACEPEQ